MPGTFKTVRMGFTDRADWVYRELRRGPAVEGLHHGRPAVPGTASMPEPQPHPPSRLRSAPADLSGDIPKAAVGRLSLYLRELRRLCAGGVEHVSSRQLGKLLGVSDAIVRRDLGYLHPQGKRGVGYRIVPLVQQIRRTLGSNHVWNVVLIGVGSLGNALLRYQGFQEQGFRWVAAFDVDPQRIGSCVGEVPIFDSRELEQRIVDLQANLAIVAIPAAATAEIGRRLSSAGITGILNFAPVVLQVGEEICVTNVDLASELQQLAFSVLSQKDAWGTGGEELGGSSAPGPSAKPKKNG